MRKRYRLKLRSKRLSSNRIFISNGEFKHTNNKVVINLYLFNRQKYNYFLKCKRLNKKIFKSRKNNYIKYKYKLANHKKYKLASHEKYKNRLITTIKSKNSYIKKYKNRYKNVIKSKNNYVKKYNSKFNSFLKKHGHLKSTKLANKINMFITIYKNISTKISLLNCIAKKKASILAYEIKYKQIAENNNEKYNFQKISRKNTPTRKKLFKISDKNLSLTMRIKNKRSTIIRMKRKIININKYFVQVIIETYAANVMNYYIKRTSKMIILSKKNLLKSMRNSFRKKKYFIANKLNKEKRNLLKSMGNSFRKRKYFIINRLKVKNKKFFYISMYISNFYKKFINKSLKRFKLLIYYKQLLYINRSKYNYNYLQFLSKYLSSIFNKNIEYNLINIKRFYLNSDILSESLKLKLTKSRKRIIRKLKLLKNKVKIYGKNHFIKEVIKKEPAEMTSFLLKNKYITHKLKYKQITGFSLRVAGRLTRRRKASKSFLKRVHKGNLMDLKSSYKKLSNKLLKGNLESNLQHTKLKSKSAIGSFGIKGWISGN